MGGNRDSFRGGRGRGRGGGRGRGRGFSFGGRETAEQNKGQWQTNERISEPEAGITQYISEAPGFQGVIKSRYSDFHVNEIDLEGNEAVLTDLKMPESLASEVEPEVVTVRDDLKQFMNDADIKKIDELVNSESADGEHIIDVTDYDKDKRAKLHHTLKSIFGKKIFNETVTKEAKKFIHVKRSTKSDQQRSLGWKWPHEYTFFVMFKENIDTLQAIAALSNTLKMKPALFSYAGTKDKRAKTSQWICARKVEPIRICNAARRCQGVRVGNFKFQPESLRLGSLKGNRFRIALRSVTGDKSKIELALESLRDFGFINYYGLQRFGNCHKIPTYMIGKALLASDFNLAVELILREREGEPNHMKEMRKIYSETKSAKKALAALHTTNTCVEARVLHGLVKHGDSNYLQALLNLPRNMLMLYTHAYQSFIFNQVASKRRELGLELIEGDLVFTETLPVEEIDILEDEASANLKEATDDDEVPETVTESKYMSMVRPLTKEDIEGKHFSIDDVVLPLPGFDIKYPSTEIGKIYSDLLGKDNLSSEKLNNKHFVFSLSGAYRKVFVKPKNLSWKFMQYQSQTADLLISDYSKIYNDPEPENDPNGENLALLLDFVLPPSAYATMALREIMKCDTSVGSQMNLESGIKKAAEAEIERKRINTQDGTEGTGEPKRLKIDEVAEQNFAIEPLEIK